MRLQVPAKDCVVAGWRAWFAIIVLFCLGTAEADNLQKQNDALREREAALLALIGKMQMEVIQYCRSLLL